MNATAMPPPLPPVPRSPFVTAVAWISLGLCTLGLVALVVEVAIFAVFDRAGVFSRLHDHLALDPQAAAFVATALQWLPWVVALFALQNLLFIVASVGLLKRREWARRLFIGLLALLIAWQFVSIPLQWSMVDHMQGLMMMGREIPPEMQAPMRAQMEASLIVSRLFGIAFGLAFCGLFAWLIWKLRTPRVRAEFAGARFAGAHGTSPGVPL